MSIQENVQIAKDTFAAFGRGDMHGLLALSAEGGSFRANGLWPARTTGTREWRICFRRLPKCWKFHSQSPASS
jgi:ketosteroid isomerase-like protein